MSQLRCNPAVIALSILYVLSIGYSADQRKPTVPRQPPLTSHVILISINGLGAEHILRPDLHKLRIPNLRALRDKGAHAVAVESVYPSLSLPAHATIATGMLPVDHGIFADYKFDEAAGIESSAKYSQANEIKTETIWDIASRAGLATASAGYPLTSGAQIGFYLPPGQKVEAIVDLIDKQHPNLLLINFTSLDEAQSKFGPDSREAIAALEGIDSQINEIARATSAEETTFVIVSDAGRMRVERELHPNVVLAKKGLLSIDGQNRITSWRAICQTLGGAAAVFVKSEKDEKLIAEVQKAFREIHDRPDSPIWRIMDRRDAARLGADPRPEFFLDAAPLYRMSSEAGGGTVSGASVRASSGYLPQRSELRAALIMAGKGVKPGVRIEYARLIDIAPTVARLLGLEMGSARGRVLNEVVTGGS